MSEFCATSLMKSTSQFVLRLYKRLISPLLPPSCKYTPTCSEYAVEAIEHYGVLRGGLMAGWRVLRCNPFAKGGYDPVVRSPSSHLDQSDEYLALMQCRAADRARR